MSSIEAMRSEASTSLRGGPAAADPFFPPGGILCFLSLHREKGVLVGWPRSWGLGLGRAIPRGCFETIGLGKQAQSRQSKSGVQTSDRHLCIQ
jgi:hypothetical protein